MPLCGSQATGNDKEKSLRQTFPLTFLVARDDVCNVIRLRGELKRRMNGYKPPTEYIRLLRSVSVVHGLGSSKLRGAFCTDGSKLQTGLCIGYVIQDLCYKVGVANFYFVEGRD
jgi:hypothetical protein